jgi:hypothetical protein
MLYKEFESRYHVVDFPVTVYTVGEIRVVDIFRSYS